MNLVEIFSDFKKKVIELFYSLQDKSRDIKTKLENLEEVNLSKAISLLEENKITDAFQRLKIMKILWRNNNIVNFYLCILYIINEEPLKSKKILYNNINKEEFKYMNQIFFIENRENELLKKFLNGRTIIEIRDEILQNTF